MKRCSPWYVVAAASLLAASLSLSSAGYADDPAPVPLLSKGHSVDWWFVFKFNAKVFPGCAKPEKRECIFGGELQDYRLGFGQEFVFASSENPTLKHSNHCLGDTETDPVGATFAEVYDGHPFYVIWSDQFYTDPTIHHAGCSGDTNTCGDPWAHSKGVLAWNKAGEGVIMQVTTPNWPGSGSPDFDREAGNTLGCLNHDNIVYSQDFFSVKLNKTDLVTVLEALRNASISTDPTNEQIVRNGGPAEVSAIVETLGKVHKGKTVLKEMLSSGVQVISKPSDLQVPPWHLVSAELGGVNLRVASWRNKGDYGSTTADDEISCWDETLADLPYGAVEAATTGHWQDPGKKDVVFSLNSSGKQLGGNHAKFGISTSGRHYYTIFGDMNEQGDLDVNEDGECPDHQNPRGGLFFIVEDKDLHNSVGDLIAGKSAPHVAQ